MGADGVYLDCFDQMPLSCKDGTCTAIRNRGGNNASIVTPQQVSAYVTGKMQGLKDATAIVRKGSGGMFTAKTWDVTKSHDPYGANTAIVGPGNDPKALIRRIQGVMKNSGYEYVLVGGGYSNL